MPKLIANILCHNDLIYLQNLIPQVETFVDHIIVVDDCSTDGTKEFLERRPMVTRVERKFDFNFSNQRNFGLDMVSNGDWVFRIDSDELPTTRFLNGARDILCYLGKRNVDRITTPIFHLTNLSMCKIEIGVELRLFKKNSSCIYKGKAHEIIHGSFDGILVELPQEIGMVHFKYADLEKVETTKTFYIDNELYDKNDLDRRLSLESTFLPPFIDFEISEELKYYLCTKNI